MFGRRRNPVPPAGGDLLAATYSVSSDAGMALFR